MTDQSTQPNHHASLAGSRAAVGGRAARWGLLVVALLLGVGLIGSSVWSYRQARALAETLARGQAEAFLRSLRERTRPELGPPSSETLEQVLSAQAEGGLRYLALLDREGQVVRAVGEPAAVTLATPPPGDLVYSDHRVRMTAPPAPPPPPPPPWLWRGSDGAPPLAPSTGPPPSWPPGAAAAPWPHPPAPTKWQHPPPPHPGVLVMEFEPLAARQLIGQAKVGVGVGTVAALVLMLAAAVFWRLSLRAAGAERELVRQRHLAALGEMSAVLAHEIRNPLAAAKGHAQLLAEQLPQGEPASKRADRVVEQVKRLEELTNELLDFARSGTVTRRDVDPARLLADAVQTVGSERVAVDDRCAPAEWSLDERRMSQVLINLLRNALEVESDDGRVEATLSVTDDRLVIEVRDRGPGIETEQRDRLFEPFHTTRVRGTGLGLVIARRIVQLHGGTIEGTNHPERGALFRVTIPADPGSADGASEVRA